MAGQRGDLKGVAIVSFELEGLAADPGIEPDVCERRIVLGQLLVLIGEYRDVLRKKCPDHVELFWEVLTLIHDQERTLCPFRRFSADTREDFRPVVDPSIEARRATVVEVAVETR